VKNQPPDIVVYPRTTEEVSEIAKLCAVHEAPLIPFGTGTSLEGHINAPHGGVSVDLSLMNGSSPFMRRIWTAWSRRG
jgi:D-lactate dehydrogenase (cytochrome)